MSDYQMFTDAGNAAVAAIVEECKYCGGDCPNDEEHACDGYLGDIDGLYEADDTAVRA